MGTGDVKFDVARIRGKRNYQNVKKMHEVSQKDKILRRELFTNGCSLTAHACSRVQLLQEPQMYSLLAVVALPQEQLSKFQVPAQSLIFQ